MYSTSIREVPSLGIGSDKPADVSPKKKKGRRRRRVKEPESDYETVDPSEEEEVHFPAIASPGPSGQNESMQRLFPSVITAKSAPTLPFANETSEFLKTTQASKDTHQMGVKLLQHMLRQYQGHAAHRQASADDGIAEIIQEFAYNALGDADEEEVMKYLYSQLKNLCLSKVDVATTVATHFRELMTTLPATLMRRENDLVQLGEEYQQITTELQNTESELDQYKLDNNRLESLVKAAQIKDTSNKKRMASLDSKTKKAMQAQKTMEEAMAVAEEAQLAALKEMRDEVAECKKVTAAAKLSESKLQKERDHSVREGDQAVAAHKGIDKEYHEVLGNLRTTESALQSESSERCHFEALLATARKETKGMVLRLDEAKQAQLAAEQELMRAEQEFGSRGSVKQLKERFEIQIRDLRQGMDMAQTQVRKAHEDGTAARREADDLRDEMANMQGGGVDSADRILELEQEVMRLQQEANEDLLNSVDPVVVEEVEVEVEDPRIAELEAEVKRLQQQAADMETMHKAAMGAANRNDTPASAHSPAPTPPSSGNDAAVMAGMAAKMQELETKSTASAEQVKVLEAEKRSLETKLRAAGASTAPSSELEGLKAKTVALEAQLNHQKEAITRAQQEAIKLSAELARIKLGKEPVERKEESTTVVDTTGRDEEQEKLLQQLQKQLAEEREKHVQQKEGLERQLRDLNYLLAEANEKMQAELKKVAVVEGGIPQAPPAPPPQYTPPTPPAQEAPQEAPATVPPEAVVVRPSAAKEVDTSNLSQEDTAAVEELVARNTALEKHVEHLEKQLEHQKAATDGAKQLLGKEELQELERTALAKASRAMTPPPPLPPPPPVIQRENDETRAQIRQLHSKTKSLSGSFGDTRREVREHLEGVGRVIDSLAVSMEPLLARAEEVGAIAVQVTAAKQALSKASLDATAVRAAVQSLADGGMYEEEEEETDPEEGSSGEGATKGSVTSSLRELHEGAAAVGRSATKIATAQADVLEMLASLSETLARRRLASRGRSRENESREGEQCKRRRRPRKKTEMVWDDWCLQELMSVGGAMEYGPMGGGVRTVVTIDDALYRRHLGSFAGLLPWQWRRQRRNRVGDSTGPSSDVMAIPTVAAEGTECTAATTGTAQPQQLWWQPKKPQAVTGRPGGGGVKPLSWLMKHVALILDDRAEVEKKDCKEGLRPQPLKQHIEEWAQRKFGVVSLVQSLCCDISAAVSKYRAKADMIEDFARMVEGRYPPEELSFFLCARAAVGRAIDGGAAGAAPSGSGKRPSARMGASKVYTPSNAGGVSGTLSHSTAGSSSSTWLPINECYTILDGLIGSRLRGQTGGHVFEQLRMLLALVGLSKPGGSVHVDDIVEGVREAEEIHEATADSSAGGEHASTQMQQLEQEAGQLKLELLLNALQERLVEPPPGPPVVVDVAHLLRLCVQEYRLETRRFRSTLQQQLHQSAAPRNSQGDQAIEGTAVEELVGFDHFDGALEGLMPQWTLPVRLLLFEQALRADIYVQCGNEPNNESSSDERPQPPAGLTGKLLEEMFGNGDSQQVMVATATLSGYATEFYASTFLLTLVSAEPGNIGQSDPFASVNVKPTLMSAIARYGNDL
jgi:hypothetical protein